MIALQGIEGFIAGQTIAVSERGMRMGRRRDNDLVLDDSTVSGEHARIEVRDDAAYLIDQQSTNGCFVNGIQIEQTALRHGDEIRIGDCVMRYRDRPEAVLLSDEQVAAPTGVQATQIVRPSESRATVIERQTQEALASVGGTSAEAAMQALTRLVHDAAQIDSVVGILDLVLELVFSVARVDRGAALLLDELTQQPTHSAVRYRSEDAQQGRQDMPLSGTLARRAISEGSALLVADAAADPTLAMQDSIIQHGIRCAAYIPMISEDRVVGLLCVDAAGPGAITEQDLEVIAAFANQASLSVERVLLKEQLLHEVKARMGLQRYVSPQVAEALLRTSGEMPPSAEAEVTVLFADLTGFTPLAEQMEPQEVCGLLNAVFESLTQVVFNYGGTIDKYIGDCVMAIWGAPFPDPMHAARAAVAAVAMIEELEERKQEWSDKYSSITLGIAINSGPVTVGNIGSERMQQWTAIGDVVNVAARIEDLAGANQILLSAATAAHCEPFLELACIGGHALKGKQEMIEVFEVAGVKDATCFDKLSLADGVVLIG